MDLSSLGKVLVVVGVAVACLGALLMAGGALGLGRLPGDIAIRRGNFRFYAPLATCLLLSLVATVILTLLGRR